MCCTLRCLAQFPIARNAHGNCFWIVLRRDCFCWMCSGLLPSLIGIAHVAIQFPLYEACKSWFEQRALRTRNKKDLNTLELVTASAVSKMIASTATYPHEVLRSHMHVTGSGPFNGFMQVGKEVGHPSISVVTFLCSSSASNMAADTYHHHCMSYGRPC